MELLFYVELKIGKVLAFHGICILPVLAGILVAHGSSAVRVSVVWHVKFATLARAICVIHLCFLFTRFVENMSCNGRKIG